MLWAGYLVTCHISTQTRLEERAERHGAFAHACVCACARMLAAGWSAVAEKWRSGGAEVWCRGGALGVVDATRVETRVTVRACGG